MGKKNMLIFEDDPATQIMYKRIFRDEYELSIYESYEKFMSDNSKKEIDIILMDISLRGDKDGLEITRLFRGQEKFKCTTIICVTAHAFNRDINNAREAGVTEVITKPFTKYELKSSINALIL